MDKPASRLSAEQWLARVFADAAPRHFGTGWLSGVLGIVLGLLALFAGLPALPAISDPAGTAQPLSAGAGAACH